MTFTDSGDMLKKIFNTYIDVHGGEPKVTEFKRYIDRLIKTDIKPLCARSGKSAGDGSWRSEQKANFAGRGAKWVKIKTEYIEPTLKRFERDDIDCSEYRSWIEKAGFAWIRYSGPRVDGGVGQAAFEVRTSGSKIDHPKQLHYMYDNGLMEFVESLGGTPHALKLEEAVSDVLVSDETEMSEVPVSDETEDDAFEGFDEGYEVQDLSVYETEAEVVEAPTSDDPEDWEAFLKAEGLGADQFDDEGDEDIFASYED